MVKKVVLGTLGSAVVTTLVGWLLFGVLFADMMKEMMANAPACFSAEPKMFFVILANFGLSLMITLLFVKMKINTVRAGITTGTWIVFFVILWYDLWAFANFDFMNVKTLLFDVVGNTFIGAVGGGVLGWILSKLE